MEESKKLGLAGFEFWTAKRPNADVEYDEDGGGEGTLLIYRYRGRFCGATLIGVKRRAAVHL